MRKGTWNISIVPKMKLIAEEAGFQASVVGFWQMK